jgi:hypothetical protein
VRADFVLGHSPLGDRRTYKRWRGILRDVLPRLLGCERRCTRAEKVRLRSVADHPLFSAWLRIPIERRPGKKRMRKLRERLRNRLERSLLLIDGRVVKVGVRRCRRKNAGYANPPMMPVNDTPPLNSLLPVEVPVSLPMMPETPEPVTPVAEQVAAAAPAA